jgi:excisionase family DNA binding protein
MDISFRLFSPVFEAIMWGMRTLTARQVAKLLGVRVETVYRYARGRKIPVVRVGGAWRFPAGEIEAWLQNGGSPEGRQRRAPAVDPGGDPILKVIGLGSDGRLAGGLDRALYGSGR